MEYLSSAKNWKYHVKSALVTFWSSFSLIFVWEMTKYSSYLEALKPEDITFAAITSGAIMVARVAFIAILKAAWELIKKVR